MVSNSAVATWLHFLQMDQYLTEFLDNGYDDLETAKKVSVIASTSFNVTSVFESE